MDSDRGAPAAPLGFSAMEARISKLPDLPDDSLRPGWFIRGAAYCMGVGLALGLVPSFLLTTAIPDVWLLHAARLGLWMAFAGFIPWLFYNVYVIVKDLRHWVPFQARQMDHQRAQFLEEVAWLRSYPENELRSMLDYVRYSAVRRAGRIGLIAGSADKLGILPVLAALFLLFRGGGDPLATTGWQAALGILLSAFWIICWVATSARGRLQIYEFLLDAALKRQR